MKKILLLTVALLSACSSLITDQRRFLDSSTHEDSPPKFVREGRTSWEESGKIMLKASHTIRGDERVNGCFDLTHLNAKEALLSEIADEVKGSIDNAQQSISENAESILGKVRTSEFSGKITGLRFTEQYFERYRIGDIERIDCHSLSEISNLDYNRVKNLVVNKIAEVDPRIKEAISKKQIDFFKKETPAEVIHSTQSKQEVKIEKESQL